MLQCWALQTALEKLGHEVVAIDRWLDKYNGALELGYRRWGFKEWTKFWIRSFMCLGDINRWIRAKRTKYFIGKYLNLTPYHFVEWRDAPKELGIDLLVVGSDQIWHCGDWNDPRVYLLEGAPSIPAVAYAASFGMPFLPEFLSDKDRRDLAEPIYIKSLAKFKAISCREREGVRICERMNIKAEHVLDPTLLVDTKEWLRLSPVRKSRKKLVCYFLKEQIESMLPHIKRFAEKEKCNVEVFGNGAFTVAFPTSVRGLCKWVAFIKDKYFSGVRFMDSAGPLEFVRSFSSATWVVSDSFHAMAIASIYGANVRILKPHDETRARMFSRICEFAEHANGHLVADNIMTALDSFKCGETVKFDCDWLCKFREDSLRFLKDACSSK